MTDYYWTFDFGVNYATNRFTDDDIDQEIKNAYEKGVDKFVSISNNLIESRRNIELSQKYDQLYFTIGCHPHYAKLFDEINDIDFIKKHINISKCIAIGECGLNFNRNITPKNKQIEVFRIHVKLAKIYNLPLFIHYKDAFEDIKEVLESENYFNGIIHNFSGNVEQALYFKFKGLKLGITGFISDENINRYTIQALKDERITISDLIVESNCPFMPIIPNKISKPEDTCKIVQLIAKIKDIDEIECGKKLYENAMKFIKK